MTPQTSFALLDYEIKTLFLDREGIDCHDAMPTFQDDFEVALRVGIDGSAHNVRASMTIVDDRDVLTSYHSDTVKLAGESALQEWLDEQLDEIWAGASDQENEASDEQK